MVTLARLVKTWGGRPIPNCPGRWVLRLGDNTVGPRQFVGSDLPTTEHCVPTVPDRIVVTWLGGWGLISYNRRDGTWVHTANAPDGFRRKLTQLTIPTQPLTAPLAEDVRSSYGCHHGK